VLSSPQAQPWRTAFPFLAMGSSMEGRAVRDGTAVLGRTGAVAVGVRTGIAGWWPRGTEVSRAPGLGTDEIQPGVAYGVFPQYA